MRSSLQPVCSHAPLNLHSPAQHAFVSSPYDMHHTRWIGLSQLACHASMLVGSLRRVCEKTSAFLVERDNLVVEVVPHVS